MGSEVGWFLLCYSLESICAVEPSLSLFKCMHAYITIHTKVHRTLILLVFYEERRSGCRRTTGESSCLYLCCPTVPAVNNANSTLMGFHPTQHEPWLLLYFASQTWRAWTWTYYLSRKLMPSFGGVYNVTRGRICVCVCAASVAVLIPILIPVDQLNWLCEWELNCSILFF